MSLLPGQPAIRFNTAEPEGMAGVSYLPKLLTYITPNPVAAGDYDFWVTPAGVLVVNAFIHTEVALDGSGTAELGLDGNVDAMIDTLDFDPTTINNFQTMSGSGNADNTNGLYLAASDVVRLTVGGTPTVGQLRVGILYFELDEMQANGFNIVGS